MNARTRLRRIETAMGIRSREPESLEQMSDDALAVLITGNPDARASDLSDQDLERIAGD